MWIVQVLVALLFAISIGCSSEPVVVEKIVEKEVIKEVPVESPDIEATVEARVAAALGTAVPEATATSSVASRPVPTATAQPVPTATATSEPKLNITESISASNIAWEYVGGYTCALRENGEAVCWGVHKHNRGADDPPSGRFTAISAGEGHTCALRESGVALCWGNNNLGQSDTGGRRFAAISAGIHHTCALRESGDAECWGDNSSGQLYSPDGRFTAIDGGKNHTCALRSNGDAECWGANGRGQATDVRGEGFTKISAGMNHTCALRLDGTGACWGGGGSSIEDVRVVELDGPFMAISAGRDFTCALSEDGEAICWGDNTRGQLDVPGGIRFTAISAGFFHTCALRTSGEAVCWGLSQSPPPGRFALPNNAPSSSVLPSGSSFDAASVLARFSTTDQVEGEARADATGEIIAQYSSGKGDGERVLDLLHTIVPELSISERRQAADKLASISEDDKWDEGETAEGVFYLASLIAGDEPNPEERIEAAHEMVALYEVGELDAERGLDLMDTIAPSMSINKRRQAAAALAKLSTDQDWDHADRMSAASEVFRLVTGVALNAEERMGAAVDLTGVGMKIFDTDDSFEDRDIDRATEIIKKSLTGELTTESLQNILSGGR